MHNHHPPLHTRLVLHRTWPNRLFALTYTCTIVTLLYHQTTLLFHTTNTTISILMLLSDIVLAFMWFTHQGFRMNPIRRKTFVENLTKDETRYPALDVFICTADPYKEPPMVVVNTVLSVMSYDYPTEKLSVYLSDDGGSKVTLFALIEAAKYAKHWLPYCKKNGIMDRCPQAYFSTNYTCFSNTNEIKSMYESMKVKVEESMTSGNIYPDEKWAHIFNQWDDKFKHSDHPTVIQLRVSEIMTNAPIILTVDCDMYSNDPKTPLQAMCYFLDPSRDSDNIGYIQYPQMFHGINEDDLYGAEFKFVFQINMAGLDGLSGPSHIGTGCYFRRRAFYGGPLSDAFEVSPTRSIWASEVLTRAHHVASSSFEAGTKWGTELGYRYGSLVEDFYTGYSLQCQGWKSVFSLPKRPAFLGNAPMNLHDLLNQTRRWSIGLLDAFFSKYNTFSRRLTLLPFLQSICYIHYALWPVSCIPVLIYSVVPQLALIHSFPIFPEVSDPWFSLYVFSFVGAYFQDFIEFKLSGGTPKGWFNNQRMWLIRCLSSYLFGTIEYTLTKLNISSSTFTVTSKVVDEQATKRYEQGMMEFGVESSLFYPISVAALVNLAAFIYGITRIFKYGGLEKFFVQVFVSGFGVVNSWPIYEAMFIRCDSGRMPTKITRRSIAIVLLYYLVSLLVF